MTTKAHSSHDGLQVFAALTVSIAIYPLSILLLTELGFGLLPTMTLTAIFILISYGVVLRCMLKYSSRYSAIKRISVYMAIYAGSVTVLSPVMSYVSDMIIHRRIDEITGSIIIGLVFAVAWVPSWVLASKLEPASLHANPSHLR